MALPNNAVSMEGTILKNKSLTSASSHKIDSPSTKKFSKNVFLSALLLSNFFISEAVFALSVEPIKVMSAMGAPFRGQIVISDIAGVNPATIHASLASDNEFIQLGINKRNLANDLHFATTIVSPERGIITVTSDRPLTDPYIEFVVHIDFGRNVRLQQVTALVDPPLTRIQTDTLNLPIKKIELAETTPTPSTPAPQATTSNPNLVKVTSTITSRTVQLIPSKDAPPPMDDTPQNKQSVSAASTNNVPLVPKTSAPPSMSAPDVDHVQTISAIAPPPIAPIVTQPPTTPTQTPTQTTMQPVAATTAATPPSITDTPTPTPPAITPSAKTTAQPADNSKKSYIVQRHDSLWSIASRMQKDMNIPVTVIMRSIQQNNQSAFIHGNPNQIRNGATITLPNQQDMAQSIQPDLQPIKVENENIEDNKTPTIRSQTQQAKEAKTPYIRRGHLPDAKMTLVAPTDDGSAQGSTTKGQSDAKQTKLNELNLKITTTRQQNMTLGQEVGELEAKIKANDQKLALQNAKLAELMQRLKNRKDTAPQNAK